MRVAIALGQRPFQRGADMQRALALEAALREAGHAAEVVALPFAATPPEALAPQLAAFRLLDLSESMGTPIDRLIALDFPASTLVHPAKVLWLGPAALPAEMGDEAADVAAMAAQAGRVAAAESRRVFATSRAAADQVLEAWERPAQTLYWPPALAPLCRNATPEDYLLVCGGHRLGLVLEALARARPAIRAVVVASRPVSQALAAVEALGASRVEWVVAPEPAHLARLLSAATAALFASPGAQDAGDALAAMLCARPLVATADAGLSVELIEPGATGLVCQPDADSLAAALGELWASPRRARSWGEEGRLRCRELGVHWPGVVECLLAPG